MAKDKFVGYIEKYLRDHNYREGGLSKEEWDFARLNRFAYLQEAGWTQAEIAETLKTSIQMVAYLRRKWATVKQLTGKARRISVKRINLMSCGEDTLLAMLKDKLEGESREEVQA